MKKVWIKNLVQAAGMIALALSLVNCSKSKNSSTATTSGYVTCPSTGYYTYNGASYACTPGTSVYVGTSATTTTAGYVTCTNGYYVSNGVTYTCQAGSTVYVGGTTTTTTTISNSCAQYTAMYGVQYVQVLYGGQYVCMRYDIVYGGYY